jgi:predicted ATPase
VNALPYLKEAILRRDDVPDFTQYPFNLPAVRSFSRLSFHPAVTYLIGENGTGKSTLLEAIAVAWGFNPEGGSKNFNFRTHNSHSHLCDYMMLGCSHVRPYDGYFLRAESFYNVASEIDRLDEEGSGPRIIDSYGGVSLHEQSHGESFFALMVNRFRPDGLYILDEPEAALSPSRQMSILGRIHHLAKQNSQFIIATHSPIIMAYPNARIYHLSEEGIKTVQYEETEHYFVTREFLNNRERMLKILMEE